MSSSEISSSIELTFNHEFVSNLVRSHYGTNIRIVDFKLKRKGLPGENYMSVIYNLRVSVSPEKKDSNEGDCVLSLILKAIPTNPHMLKYIRDLKAFEKEVMMFQKVFPALLSPDSSSYNYNALPKCISASIDDQTGYILMEDLTNEGYKMANRVAGLDLDHAKLAISELAKFHALSFIKFHGNGEVILKNYPDLVDMFWIAPDKVSERNHGFIIQTLETIKQVLQQENKEHVIPRVERHFLNVFERMHKQASIPERFPSVINFGDCWTNNCMFQYDEQGKPKSIKFLDFQLARVTSRCSDLAYLLFTSLNMKTLNENFDLLLRTYHESFNLFVSSHDNGKGANLLQYKGEELTWEYFNLEFEQYRSHGTTLALIYTPLMLASTDSIPDLDKISADDLKQMGNEKKSDFANVWKCKAVREKLLAIASGHLPMCFKPAQVP